MRLLIVGTLHGQLTLATKLAMDKGATVTHAESAEQALKVLRAGRGADLMMVDVAVDIRGLVKNLEAERIHIPIVACGTSTDARAAVAGRPGAAGGDFGDRGAAAGEAPARDPGAHHRPRRRHAAGAGRHPHHRHLDPQPDRRGARGHVPRGPALPPQRGEPEDPALTR